MTGQTEALASVMFYFFLFLLFKFFKNTLNSKEENYTKDIASVTTHFWDTAQSKFVSGYYPV